MSQRSIPFSDLSSANLVVDTYYEGGRKGNAGDDPISKLLPCGNQGGFRTKRNNSGSYAFAVLYSSLDEPDWPDHLDEEMGLFTYYGDNRSPGHSLHDTPRKGNELLRRSYNSMYKDPPDRENVPPFFVFTKGTRGRDVVFRGLGVPGSNLLKANEELVAIWKNKAGERFQNYQTARACSHCNSLKGDKRLYEFFSLEKRNEIPRIAEGKYLKLLYTELGRRDLLRISKENISELCDICDLEVKCPVPEDMTVYCLEGVFTK